jgi:hypothetical protein
MEAVFFAAWTVEERAGLVLEGEYRPRLAKLYDDGEIPLAMVTRLGVTAPSMDSRKEFWGEVCTAMEEQEPAKAISKLKRRAMISWFLEPTAAFGDEEDVTEQAMDEPGEGPSSPPYRSYMAPPTIPRPPAARAKTGPEDDPLAATQEARDDLLYQGASRTDQLYALSVSLELGWKATPVETAGGQYGSSVEMAAAIKRMAKSSKASSKTLSDLLNDGSTSGDVSLVERHLDRMTQKFMADPSDTFYVSGATRVNRAWLKGRGIDPGDLRVGCRYLWLLIDDSHGRGLGKSVDLELMRTAERMVMETDRKVGSAHLGLGSAHASKAASVASGYTGLSGISASAASSAATKQMEEMTAAMVAQMKELMELTQDLQKASSRNDSKMGELSAVVKGLKKGPAGDSSTDRGKCLVCGKEGHRAANCPLVKAAKERQEEGTA